MSDDTATTGAARETPAPARLIAGPLAWLPWLAAVGFALLLGLLGQAYFSLRSEMTALREQAALADIESRSLQQQLEAGRILAARRLDQSPAASAQLRVVPLFAGAGPHTSVGAVVIWDAARQEGELAAFQLPALPSGQAYRICIIDPQYPDPVGAGSFAVEPPAGDARIVMKPARPIGTATRFTICAGSLAGEPRPSDPVVLSSR